MSALLCRGAWLAALVLTLLLQSAAPALGQEDDPAPTPAAEPAPPPEEVAGDTPRLGGDGPPGLMTGLGQATLETTGAAADLVTRDDMGATLEAGEKLFKQQAAVVDGAAEGAAEGGGSVVGSALNKINLWNTAVKAAAYAWEGDTNGAINVVLKEGVKKVTGAGLQFVGSFIPGVGNIIGGAANEELNSRYIAPFMDKHTDEARNKEAREKYLGWDLPGDQVMDSRGNVRELARGMYLDPETGLVKGRSAAEQQAYETRMRRDYQAAARSEHPLSKAQRRLARGEIDDSEFGRICREWNNNPDRDNWRQAAGSGGSGAHAPPVPRSVPGYVRQPTPEPTQRQAGDPNQEDLSKLSADEYRRRLNTIYDKDKQDVAQARRELKEALKKLREARQSK